MYCARSRLYFFGSCSITTGHLIGLAYLAAIAYVSFMAAGCKNEVIPPPTSFSFIYGSGNQGWHSASGIALDVQGNILLTNSFNHGYDFDPGPGDMILYARSEFDAFLSKFDSSGDFVWVRTWGGDGLRGGYTGTFGQAVVTDSSGDIYVVGTYTDPVDFDPGPKNEFRYPCGSSAFLSKFNPNGDFLWVRTWGGSFSLRIAMDESDTLFITGYYRGKFDFDPGPATFELDGDGVFLSSFDRDGELQWVRTWEAFDENATYLKSRSELTRDIDLGKDGEIYVTGQFLGTVYLEPDPGSNVHTSMGETDMYLSAFETDGNFRWVRAWGGPRYDESCGVAVDSLGNVYACGSFEDTVDFDPGSGTQLRTVSGKPYRTESFLSKFSSNGDFLWVRTWGDENGVWNDDVELDSNDNIYVTGCLKSGIVDLDPGPGNHPIAAVGRTDAFLVMLDHNGSFVNASVWGSSRRADRGRSVIVDDSGNVYVESLWNWKDFVCVFPPDGNW